MTPITRVQTLVCETYGITVADMLRKDRHKTVTEARHVAMFLCRVHLDPQPSFPEIGRAFGNRDHTTVMAAVSRVLRRITLGTSPGDTRIVSRVTALSAKLGTAPTGRADLSLMPLAKIELDPNWEGRSSGSAAE